MNGIGSIGSTFTQYTFIHWTLASLVYIHTGVLSNKLILDLTVTVIRNADTGGLRQN
jgi:hypothetical protein